MWVKISSNSDPGLVASEDYAPPSKVNKPTFSGYQFSNMSICFVGNIS